MKTKLLFLFVLSGCALLHAQPTTNLNRRVAHIRRAAQSPKIDGDLSDPAWAGAEVLSDFVVFAPTFGKPASERTEVRLLYTDEAVYIGAYMYMADASKIRTDLSKRDAQSTADQFHVGFDTYRDRQNAFRFEVTAAGVQRDLRMSPENNDVSWDAVWDAKVKLHADGWSAEMRIPFSAIRFPGTERQVWGLQFARQIQYLNEFDTWSPVDPNGGGAMPQWADMEGLESVDPPLRLSFSPYLAGVWSHAPAGDGTYANARNLSGGMDVKWGISESFTLDATLVPNFGEAQSDNTVRNLSPFEIQYEERRQFFTEGTELFNKAGTFYSRRIGGRPPGFFSAVFSLDSNEIIHKNPSQQALYNATKLSGRTRSKLGIGVLNAVGAPAYAVIHNNDTGADRNYQTAELSNYNVVVLDQVLPNNSFVALTNTNVLREGPGRDANVSALNFHLRDKTNTYALSGEARWSEVFGSSGHTGGGLWSIAASKVSGKWGGTVQLNGADARYDQRDLGLFSRNNYLRQFASVNYSNYQPKGNRLQFYWEFFAENTYLNNPRRWEALEVFSYASWLFKNQWQFGGFMVSRPIWFYDFYEPRVWGKQYYHAPYLFISPQITSDTRKKLFCSFNLQFGESPIKNDPYIGIGVSPTWVASDHLRLMGNMYLSKDHSNFGAVNWDDPDNIVFGRRDVTTFDNEISAEYLFTPRMNATIRARHYWAKLYYHEYLGLNDDGTFSPLEWNGAADENFNQFNIDFVYTWQFAPGSFLNLIWKDAVFVGDAIRTDGFYRNFNKTIHGPQDNSITLKLIYWLDAGKWGWRG